MKVKKEYLFFNLSSMDFFTHMFIGILIPIPFLGYVPPETVMFIWLMSFLPDFDILLAPLQKLLNSYFLSHKAGSHSFIIGIIFTGSISYLFNLVISDFQFLMAWLGALIGYSIHNFLDYFTASKIPLFYPISRKEYRFLADRAVNPLLASFSIINILILISLFLTGANLSIFINLFYLYSFCLVCYFGFKAILRLIIQSKLPKDSLYIPGILPYIYIIYENHKTNNKINYKLIKKRLFGSRSIDIIEKSYSFNSVEMEFIDKTLEYSKKFRFFYKWNAVIPLFKIDGDFINVILVLAESYSRRRSYRFTIIFNKNTKEIIKREEGFINLNDWLNV